jgi:serine/threonine protein kinase
LGVRLFPTNATINPKKEGGAMPRQGPRSNQRLGNKYLLGELLGEGGFGAVYSACNEVLDRIEAIKIVEPRGLDDPKWQQRFMREAQMLAKLEHPNIIPVYDCGFDANKNILYLAMPFVDGGTLEDILRGQQAPLSLRTIEEYLRQICSALDYAHAKGVVHLDLKPANLLLRRGESSTLLLSDFGLAHIIEEENIKGGTSLQFGTPHYMAPEQIQSKPQSSSDIYALGVILYRMLTNQFPYSSPGPSIYIEHLQSPIPHTTTIRPDLPVAIDQVIVNALAKNPDERFKSSGLLLKSFRAAITPPVPQPIIAAPSPKPANPKPPRVVEEKKIAAKAAQQPAKTGDVPVADQKVQQPKAIPQQQQIEYQAEKVTPAPRKKTLAERRQAFIRRIYSYPSPYSTSGNWLLPLFFLLGLGSLSDLYAQYEFTLIVLGAVSLLGYPLAYRKTTSSFTFALMALFSSIMIFLLSEKVLHVFPIIQQPETTQNFRVGTQVIAGLIISSIPAFFWWVAGIDEPSTNSFLFDLTTLVIGSIICSVLIWLIVAIPATVFNWGFGFGAGWYLGLLYQVIGTIATIGIADFIYVLFKRFE